MSVGFQNSVSPKPHPPQINLLHCDTPRQPIYLSASRQRKSTSSALSESQSHSSKQDKSGHDRHENGLQWVVCRQGAVQSFKHSGHSSILLLHWLSDLYTVKVDDTTNLAVCSQKIKLHVKRA